MLPRGTGHTVAFVTTRPTDADVIVVGLGPGGEAVAEALADAGRRVIGIDERLVGGECPYYGCVPSKMVLRAAETLAEAGRVNTLAGHASTEPDYAPVAKRIRDEATDDWDDTVAVERFEGLGGTFVRGRGRLAGRDDDGRWRITVGGATYRVPDVVLATGTDPVVPPVDGLTELRARAEGPASPVWTNREALRSPTVPATLAVLGGGPIGCELAQGFARFGTSVTVIQRAPRLLTREEPAASAVVAEVFAREGIDVHFATTLGRVEADDDGGARLRVESVDGDGADPLGHGEAWVTADKLLVATGRQPKLAGLGLESAGLDSEVRSLDVDDAMRVLDAEGNPLGGLYAVGDITGRGPFTHVATWQARVLTGHLLDRRDPPFGGYHGLAWATFTDPEVGRIGMTEAEARDAGLHVRTGRAEIASDIRGWIHGPGNDGFVQVVVDAATDTLVGATVVAPNGGEILGLLTLAVHARIPVATLATMHYVFPTLHRTVLEAVDQLT